MIGLIICGVVGGIIGGMGMGGGTLLIPLLVTFCSFSQHTAQAINLVAFIPMSIASLIVHIKNGYVRPKYLLTISLIGTLSGALFAFIALGMDGELLRRLFGWFIIIIGIWQFVLAIREICKKTK